MRFTLHVKNVTLSAAIVFAVSLHGQQFYRTELSAPMSASDSSRNIAEEKKSWVEIPEKRTLNSRTYKTPSGSIMMEQCARPINYLRDGNLEPINPALVQKGNTWQANDQPFPVRVYDSGGFTLTTESGEEIYFSCNMVDGDYAHTNLISASDQTVLFENVIPGVHRQIDVRENGARYSYIIPAPLELSGDYTRFDENLSLPTGTRLITKDGEGYWEVNNGDSMWYGNIHLINKDGKEYGCIHAPICFDENNSVVKAGIRFYNTHEGHWNLTMFVKTSWLTDANRAYPIVIDPLVTGPLAAWSGGFIPSCDMPNYSQDSILVTIPGQITVTALLVTGSFYADPFSIAVMADGAMFFSTDCN